MKLFIKKCLLFAIILLIIPYPADYIITGGLKKTGDIRGTGYTEYSTWNAIISSSIQADLIINGSSRAYRHINPFTLDSILKCQSYNLGGTGGDLNKQYVRYMTYEKYNKKPKIIIHQIDYYTFSISDSIFDERFSPYLFDIDKDLIKSHLKWLKSYHLHLPLVRYFSQAEQIYTGIVEFFHIKHFKDVRKKGFFETERTWNDFVLRRILHGDSLIAQKQPEAIELFDMYLNHCVNNGIQIIFVFTPQYYQATEFTKNKDDVMNIFRSFSEKYKIPLLDYSTDSICYNTDYFYNANHLNKKGAEKFSIQLALDINILQFNK